MIGLPCRDGSCSLSEVIDHRFIYEEITSGKQGRYRRSKQYGRQNTIKYKEGMEGLFTPHIAMLWLVFIGYGLDDKAEEYEHPNPVGAAKAGGVEEGEGGKKCPTKGYKGSKGKLPLAPWGVNNHLL